MSTECNEIADFLDLSREEHQLFISVSPLSTKNGPFPFKAHKHTTKSIPFIYREVLITCWLCPSGEPLEQSSCWFSESEQERASAWARCYQSIPLQRPWPLASREEVQPSWCQLVGALHPQLQRNKQNENFTPPNYNYYCVKCILRLIFKA